MWELLLVTRGPWCVRAVHVSMAYPLVQKCVGETLAPRRRTVQATGVFRPQRHRPHPLGQIIGENSKSSEVIEVPSLVTKGDDPALRSVAKFFVIFRQAASAVSVLYSRFSDASRRMSVSRKRY